MVKTRESECEFSVIFVGKTGYFYWNLRIYLLEYSANTYKLTIAEQQVYQW
jgi:hypothetical protein